MLEFHLKKQIDELENEIENLKTDVFELLYANAKLKDAMKQELERLRNEYSQEIVVLLCQVADLKKVLRKCSPFTIEEGRYNYCYSCKLMQFDARSHNPNCEYLKLTGGHNK